MSCPVQPGRGIWRGGTEPDDPGPRSGADDEITGRDSEGDGAEEQQKLTRKDLEPFIGTGTRVAEVLNRNRSLSIAMIRRLHEGLGIQADVLIRPSRGRTAA